MTKFRYLEIVHTEDSKVVKRLNVTGQGERSVDRIEMGMNINLNHKEYHININDSEVELVTDDKILNMTKIEKNKNITDLFDEILLDYKQTATNCITEFPCADEKKALEDLENEIAERKNKLQTLLS